MKPEIADVPAQTFDPKPMSEPSCPLYRKYANGLVYFKILSPVQFHEARIGPGGVQIVEYLAKILPDRHLIADMTYMKGGYWLEASPQEYEALIQT